MQRLTTTPGMNTVKKIYHISSHMGRWPHIPPWTTSSKRTGTCKVNVGECSTGLRDSHGVLMRKPSEIRANHRLLLTPFGRKRCSGHHQHVRNCPWLHNIP
eukprot:3272953-Pyramimonas_sp.AAC.2